MIKILVKIFYNWTVCSGSNFGSSKTIRSALFNC